MFSFTDTEWCCESANAPMEIKPLSERVLTPSVNSLNICENGVNAVI